MARCFLTGPRLFALLAATFLALGSLGAAAETSAPEPIRQLIEDMTPDQKAALVRLIETLERQDENAPEPPSAGQDMVAEFQGVVSGFRHYLAARVIAVPDFLTGIASGLSGYGGIIFPLLAVLLASVFLGGSAEFLFARFAGTWRERIRVPSDGRLGDTIAKLAMRAALEAGGVILFLLVAMLAANAVPSRADVTYIVSGFLLLAVGLPRIAGALLRFVLAPNRPDLRLVVASDAVAERLYRSLVFVFGAGGFLLFLADMLRRTDPGLSGDMRFWTSLLATAWLIATVWIARSGLTRILIGDTETPTPGLARMALWWPPVMIFLLAANWLLIQVGISSGAEVISPLRGTIVIVVILAAPFLDTMVRGISEHLVPGETAPPEGVAEPDAEGEAAEGPAADPHLTEAQRQTRQSYVRIGRTLLFSMVVIAVGKLWGLSLQGLASVGVGAAFAAHLLGAILILACGYLVWEAANLWINRRLVMEGISDTPAGHAEGGEGGHGGQSRLATILPVIRVVLSAAILIMTVLLALDHLGVNVTPLLAGAGVLGLAIGFGAQTLVKDVVSGVFFLLDDAFRTGEFIDAGGTLGTVEKISIRSLVLRSVNGPIHIIPYGEIGRITNSSRDWVIMKLRFTVPFDTDLEKVRKIFKKVGQEIMEIPELAEGIIEPFKSQGAADVDDVGIVVRGKFMTKPGRQFVVRKEIYSRVQRAFRENGIDFARKEVRVQIPGLGEGTSLTPEQENAIAAAASQAAEPVADPGKKPVADDR